MTADKNNNQNGGCGCSNSTSSKVVGGRRIAPHTLRCEFECVVLKWGEIVIDEHGNFYTGDGKTKGGIPHASDQQCNTVSFTGGEEVLETVRAGSDFYSVGCGEVICNNAVFSDEVSDNPLDEDAVSPTRLFEVSGENIYIGKYTVDGKGQRRQVLNMSGFTCGLVLDGVSSVNNLATMFSLSPGSDDIDLCPASFKDIWITGGSDIVDVSAGGVGSGNAINAFPRCTDAQTCEPTSEVLRISHRLIDIIGGDNDPNNGMAGGIKVNNTSRVSVEDTFVRGGAVAAVTLSNGTREAHINNVQASDANIGFNISTGQSVIGDGFTQRVLIDGSSYWEPSSIRTGDALRVGSGVANFMADSFHGEGDICINASNNAIVQLSAPVGSVADGDAVTWAGGQGIYNLSRGATQKVDRALISSITGTLPIPGDVVTSGAWSGTVQSAVYGDDNGKKPYQFGNVSLDAGQFIVEDATSTGAFLHGLSVDFLSLYGGENGKGQMIFESNGVNAANRPTKNALIDVLQSCGAVGNILLMNAGTVQTSEWNSINVVDASNGSVIRDDGGNSYCVDSINIIAAPDIEYILNKNGAGGPAYIGKVKGYPRQASGVTITNANAGELVETLDMPGGRFNLGAGSVEKVYFDGCNKSYLVGLKVDAISAATGNVIIRTNTDVLATISIAGLAAGATQVWQNDGDITRRHILACEEVFIEIDGGGSGSVCVTTSIIRTCAKR